MAVLGAVVWGVLGFTLRYEVGWLALGIGAAVGYAVSRYSPGVHGFVRGAIAVVLAVGSIVAGKYATAKLDVDDEIGQFMLSFEAANPYKLENAWQYYLSQKATEAANAGRRLSWPSGKSLENASFELDYPPDILAEARKSWGALGPDGQERYRSDYEAFSRSVNDAKIAKQKAEMTMDAFKSAFGPVDVLFGVLAIAAAFSLANRDDLL